MTAEEFKDIKLQNSDGSLYKTLNTLPGIRFPLATAKTSNDKCSLVVQAELRGLDLPNNVNQTGRMRHAQARAAIFKDIHRLIRCVVDCKISLSDAEAVRHALTLARSLAARAWDDWPEQLKQFPNVGSVKVRKFVAAGIKTIADLAEADPARVNVILGSKNEGEKLILMARSFPRPTIAVSLAACPDVYSSKNPTVGIRVEIGFMSSKPPFKFQQKPVFLCVLIERSDGHLLDFRRIKPQLEMEPIMISVTLTSPGQKIICRVMCDDFAGTSQVAELSPTVPQDLFPDEAVLTGNGKNESRELFKEPSGKRSAFVEQFDMGDVDDADLLAAEEQTGFRRLEEVLETSTKNPSKRKATQQPMEESETRRRPNGRFDCNHQCKDKSACKHECCKNGLEKPPKPPKSTRNQIQEETCRQRKLNQTTIQGLHFRPKAFEDAVGEIDSDASLDMLGDIRPTKRQKRLEPNAVSTADRPQKNDCADSYMQRSDSLVVQRPPKLNKKQPFTVTATDPIEEVDMLPVPENSLGDTSFALQDLPDVNDGTGNDVFGNTDPLPGTDELLSMFSGGSTIPAMPTTDEPSFDVDDYLDTDDFLSEAVSQGPFCGLRPTYVFDGNSASALETSFTAAPSVTEHAMVLDTDPLPTGDAEGISRSEVVRTATQPFKDMTGIDQDLCAEMSQWADFVDDDEN